MFRGSGDQGDVARQAVEDVAQWLSMRPETEEVRRVYDDPEFQQKSIDLVWVREKFDELVEVLIDVQGDRYLDTSKYFFETVSDDEAGIPGTLVRSEADYLYYYFTRRLELHIMPMQRTREWFVAHQQEMEQRQRKMPSAGGQCTSIGCIVPQGRIISEIGQVEVIKVKLNPA